MKGTAYTHKTQHRQVPLHHDDVFRATAVAVFFYDFFVGLCTCIYFKVMLLLEDTDTFCYCLMLGFGNSILNLSDVIISFL